MASDHADAEIQGFQPVEVEGGQIQLRFDAISVPDGATRIVPTLTLSREALSDLATKLKLLAADLPMVDGE